MAFVHILGRLAKDPETRFTAQGQKITNIIIASNSFRGGQEETIWWRVSVWGDRFDKMMPHLTKGKLIMVGGEMRKPEVYTDKNGVTQVGSIEVTGEYLKFVPIGKPDSQGGEASPASSGQYSNSYGNQTTRGNASYANNAPDPASSYENDFEEPLPF